MKDADKLKLMLLAWNYQNSNAGNSINIRSDMSSVTTRHIAKDPFRLNRAFHLKISNVHSIFQFEMVPKLPI